MSTLSIFDLFKIGIGPSSSHTVGPMWAAYRFVQQLRAFDAISKTGKVTCHLYGSLALTGAGHATDKAVILGLMGERPDEVDPDFAEDAFRRVKNSEKLMLDGKTQVSFADNIHLVWEYGSVLPAHPNGMTLRAEDKNDRTIFEESYYSVGGGFVNTASQMLGEAKDTTTSNIHVPYPFKTGRELLAKCEAQGCSIAELVLINERARMEPEQINRELDRIAKTMHDCIERGARVEGHLPGGLNVKRRAPEMRKRLLEKPEMMLKDPLCVMDWVSLYALAVNEENAAGSKVVTAPTNGAAGVIPAVLEYYKNFIPGANLEGQRIFLVTASAIGMLYKNNASISAAEVGCQGEVGVACSMAAGALAAVMNGTNQQVEQAAEIGMEHNLGLTCDPIGGLVQIPCIERNTMGAIKAINAARLALADDGKHIVHLDDVIQTMAETGADMQSKYKETALGGLAKNVDTPLAKIHLGVVEC